MAHSKNKLGPILDGDGVFHYRRRIPDDVRAALRALETSDSSGRKHDKREEKKRLGRDPIRAKQLWAEHDLRVEARWSELRKERPRHLSVEEREALAGDIYRLFLSRCPENHIFAGQNASIWLGLMQEKDREIPQWSHNHETRDDFLQDMHGHDVDRLIAERGLKISEGSRWELLEAAQRAAKLATTYALRRFNGDLRPDPEASRFPKWPNRATDTLTGLHGLWVEERRHAKPDSHAAFGSCIGKFVAFLGHDVVADVTQDDIRAWIVFLRKEGLSDIRIRDGYFAAIRTVINSARNSGLMTVNPCDGIRIDAQPRPRVREKDLRDEEVYAILKASLEKHEHASDDVAAARRWVPWLLAYTGARVAEVTRLEGRHIVEQSGIHGIDIQQSKNGRPRIVPVHRHLIEQGFLEFVKERKDRPLFFAFDKLKSDNLVIHKTRAEGLGDWARRVAGITAGEVAPQHGWRHRFKTECRSVGMDPEVRFYLQGHAFKSEGEKYGFIPLHVTAAWMSLFPTYEVLGESLRIMRVVDSSSFIAAAAVTGRTAFVPTPPQDWAGKADAPDASVLH